MPKKLDYQNIIQQHLNVLERLQSPSGLFRASAQTVDTGYDKAWLRDNFYECLAFVVLNRWDIVAKTYSALLDVFTKYEWKLDAAIANKPVGKHEYIHARYHPETFEEFWEDWGNKQNDAVGAVLFMLGELETKHQQNFLKQKPEWHRVTQKLVKYLETLQYWQDPDSGMWEEDEEVHASSVGACLAGLKSIARVSGIEVNSQLIQNGQATLDKLLPRESEKKFVDLALMSLIYPYNIVSEEQRNGILDNVEYHLVRDHGVIRYKNDYYYNRNADGMSEEAEWTFGLSWMAIIYTQLGQKDKAEQYMQQSLRTINEKGEIPELYFSNTDEYNNNSPLGWAESMFVIALYNYLQQGYKL